MNAQDRIALVIGRLAIQVETLVAEQENAERVIAALREKVAELTPQPPAKES
jgi:hypothetical protein